jgi:pyruvate formate lyase activating enzyme
MRIGGLLKFSLIDYPGKVAAVVFTMGCNYRCPFCHNPELVLPELFNAPISTDDILAFLEKRKGQLQGVVVTGGEPTIHDDLPDFLFRIKALGYFVKLDTNGSRPDMLSVVINRKLVDFIAMDIKSSPESYCKATGVAADISVVKESINLIKESGCEYQFRTTLLKKVVSENDLLDIMALIGDVKEYRLQKGNLKEKVLDYKYFADEGDYLQEEFERMRNIYSRSSQAIE